MYPSRFFCRRPFCLACLCRSRPWVLVSLWSVSSLVGVRYWPRNRSPMSSAVLELSLGWEDRESAIKRALYQYCCVVAKGTLALLPRGGGGGGGVHNTTTGFQLLCMHARTIHLVFTFPPTDNISNHYTWILGCLDEFDRSSFVRQYLYSVYCAGVPHGLRKNGITQLWVNFVVTFFSDLWTLLLDVTRCIEQTIQSAGLIKLN